MFIGQRRLAGSVALALVCLLGGCGMVPPAWSERAATRPGAAATAERRPSFDLDAVMQSAGVREVARAGTVRVLFDLGGRRSVQAATKAKTVDDVGYVKIWIKNSAGTKVFDDTAEIGKGSNAGTNTKAFVIKDVEEGTGYTVLARALDGSKADISKEEGKATGVKVEAGKTTEVDLTVKLKGGTAPDVGKVKAKVKFENGSTATAKDAAFE